jgi:hypothetical protein
MHPSADGYLHELRTLADQLFDVVCDEFTTGEPVEVRFHRVDDLAERDIEEQHLVATALLCAQLLHRVTAQPGRTRPRHVQTLTDILEQVIPPLAQARPDTSPAVVATLRGLGERFAHTAASVVMLADPGGAGYDAYEP